MGANAFTAYPYTDPNITKAVGTQMGVAKLRIELAGAVASITTVRIGSGASHYLQVALDAGDLSDPLDQVDLEEFLANLLPNAHSIVGDYGDPVVLTIRGDATPDWAAAEAGTPLTNASEVTKTGTPAGAVAYAHDDDGTVGTAVSDYDTFNIDGGVIINPTPSQEAAYDDASTDRSLATAQAPLNPPPSYWFPGRDLYANEGAQGYPGGVEAP